MGIPAATERLLCYITVIMDVPEERRSRREERREETRREIVEAATAVFAAEGFHAASVGQIAAAAGYSTGAIYWHFKGKDDLFLAVLEAYATTRAREFDEISERARGALPQRARAFADHWMARIAREPESMILLLEFLVYAWRRPALREAFGHRIAFGRIALARLLSAEGDYDSRSLSSEDLGAVLRELGTGLAVAKLADPDGISDRLFGDFVELLFELLEESSDSPRTGAAKNRRPQAQRR